MFINKQTGATKIKNSLAMVVAIALPISFAASVKALEVQVTPSKPKLGDTLSVVVTPDNPANNRAPSITVNQKTYPTFAIAPNKFRALLPTTPLEKAGNRVLQVKSGDEASKIAVYVGDRKFPVQRITLPPGKSGLKATQLELSRVAALKNLKTPQKYWNGTFLKPNKGRITTIYGVRRYYNGKFAQDYYHRGVDYAGAVGSPVMAPADGRIALVGRVSQGFRVHGNIIGIDHGQGVITTYLHLSRINVKEGDFVKAGQVIGAVGGTGAVTGPHLHWGLYVQGEAVDPVPWRNQKFN